jgi:hypothetical protein
MDPNVDWVSVSALLDAASSELNVGQLLHTSVFSLFESMSAVEIGNPKMDAGGSLLLLLLLLLLQPSSVPCGWIMHGVALLAYGGKRELESNTSGIDAVRQQPRQRILEMCFLLVFAVAAAQKSKLYWTSKRDIHSHVCGVTGILSDHV